MSKHAIGTMSWADGSRGRLTATERRSLVGQALPMQLLDWWSTLRRRLGLAPPAGARATAAWAIPDTAMAERAQAYCASVSSPSLLGHCRRSYLWGALLADVDGVRYDAELFYVSALLHDLGLTAAAPSSDAEPCFAISGARAAMRVVAEHGWPAERAAEVGDIIGQHCNVQVAQPASAEATLLRAATAFDVIGQRYAELAPEDVAHVLRDHPRAGFKKDFVELIAREARLRPGTRAAFLVERLQFLGRIRRAPFAE